MFGEMARGALSGKRIGEAASFHRAERPGRCEKIEAVIARVARDYAGCAAADLNDIGVGHRWKLSSAAHCAMNVYNIYKLNVILSQALPPDAPYFRHTTIAAAHCASGSGAGQIEA